MCSCAVVNTFGALALSEHHAGSDVVAMRTHATRKGDTCPEYDVKLICCCPEYDVKLILCL